MVRKRHTAEETVNKPRHSACESEWTTVFGASGVLVGATRRPVAEEDGEVGGVGVAVVGGSRRAVSIGGCARRRCVPARRVRTGCQDAIGWSGDATPRGADKSRLAGRWICPAEATCRAWSGGETE